MQVELNLDAPTERYVQSMEAQVEAYRTRAWSFCVLAFFAGVVVGMLLAAYILTGELP